MAHPAVNQVIVDLPDFIPELYTVNFGVCGAKYVASYGEATVDEVLVLMAEAGQESSAAKVMADRRKVVTEFYTKHLSVGDPEKLRSDLEFVPYKSFRDGLDIITLYEQLTARYPKKDLGEAERDPLPSQSGWSAKLRSFFGRAKAA